MKKTFNYPELWQKKRSELPVNGSPDADWAQMRSILDKQMPVSTVPKKPFRLKLPKWGLHVFVGVSSVVAVYTGYKLYHSTKHHELIIPRTQQAHRDSAVPLTKDTASVNDSVKSFTGISTVDGSAPLPVNQTKLNTDSATKHGQHSIDSINAPAMLSIPIRRDSIRAPTEAAQQRSVRDSVAPVNLEKKDIQKDTSSTNNKTSKKKKRSKFSVFF